MSRLYRTLLAALVVAVMPAALAAQQPSAEVQAWRTELQQAQMQLQPVQQQALQDEALSAQQEEVGNAVREAMIEADPSMGAKLDRFDEIMAEAQAAQSNGDIEKITALTQEAQVIQPQIVQAQADALAQPEIAAAVEAFQENLQAKMIEINPEAEALLARVADLDERIRRAVGG